MRFRRWALAVGTVALLGTTLNSCSYGPRYAVTLNTEGHVQVEWCFATSALVHLRPGGAVLEASGPTSNDTNVVDLATTSADDWSPRGVPSFQNDTAVEVWTTNEFTRRAATTVPSTPSTNPAGTGPTTAYTPPPPAPALTVRVGDLRQGSYWYDGGQHSLDDWLDRCDPDDGGLDSVLGLLIGGLVCFLIVVGVVLWGIISALKPRNYEPL